MISREFGNGGWKATCANNPPPLHVSDTESAAAQWWPLPRPALFPQHGGPHMVTIPAPGGFAGDDPTDPTAQTIPRVPTIGMVGRLHVTGNAGR